VSRRARPRSRRGRSRRRGPATIGLIVEGDAEYVALPMLHREDLLPGSPPMKATNLGGVGSDRTPEAIAKLLAPKVKQHVVAGRTTVVVCFDREQRAVCCPELARQVEAATRSELIRQNCPNYKLHIVVADRTFEAWLLADASGLHSRGVFRNAPTFHRFEGDMGREAKKGLVELASLLGRAYGKTSDGPALFRKLDFAAARDKSAGGRGSRSLDKFLRALGV
jgi:hypothetical protein